MNVAAALFSTLIPWNTNLYMGESGLNQVEVKKKLEQYGYNEITELVHVSPLQILLRQFKKNYVIYLLLAAMLISLFVGKNVTAYVVLGIIVLVVGVGFAQEYKAERAIKSLKRMIIAASVVIRNGKEQEIPSRDIVPGDIVVLRTGEKVPADCVILEEKELRVNESVLTGESKEVKKLAAKMTKHYKDENLLFMGSFVVAGRCVAHVMHTGMNTEFGKIAGMISTAEKELPLQNKINAITKYMITIAIAVSVFIGMVMLARSMPFSYDVLIDVLIVVIALSVSAFPEGFPVVIMTTLASGAYRMAKKNAIVNRMSIIETLGETTVICSDKTGTITMGEMTAKKIFAGGRLFDVSGAGYDADGKFSYQGKDIIPKEECSLALLLKAAVLCNDARIERIGAAKEYKAIGSPTEVALLIASAKAKVFGDDLKSERMEEIPFNSERKIMSVLCREDNGNCVYTKGAPEILIKMCKFSQNGKNVARFDDKETNRILSVNKALTKDSYRTIALAYKKTNRTDKNGVEENLVFLGLAAIEDPPRDEIRGAIKLCRTAGIDVKMITGDSKETAVAVSKEIGLAGDVLDGEDLDGMTDQELTGAIKKVAIFARVRPEHKLRIIRALKQNGEIVTMTGDGVNDAPALKEAHIGVAMGKNGTDVSRDAADIILKDDNFYTIVSAVREGRTVFNNIRKFVTYQLSCNCAELMIITIGISIGLPLPLLALQILFMNLVTDDLPAIALGFNPPPYDVMKMKPRKRSNILNRQMLTLLGIAGTIMAIGTLGVFWFVLNVLGESVSVARTSALITLILFEILNAFNFRSLRYPVHKLPPFANKYLVYASIASILATIAIVYTPLNVIFETTPISLFYWIIAAATASSVVVVFDSLKSLKRKALAGAYR